MSEKSVGHLLKQTALRYPRNEAVVYGDHRLNYYDFDRLVDSFAAGLQRHEVRVGDHVAMIATNSLEQVVTHLALNRIGAVGVLLNPQLSASELEPLFKRIEPSMVFVDEALSDKVQELRRRADGVRFTSVCIGEPSTATDYTWWNMITGPDDTPVVASLPGDSPSVMMFTSGTTGVPKAAIIEREAEWLNTILMIAELGLTEYDRNLNIAPLFHAAPWGCHFLPHMAVGACNIVVGKFKPEALPAWLRDEKVTTLLGVPTHFELVIGSEVTLPDDISLRLVSVTGAPVRKDTLHWIEANLCETIFNIYGLTEATTLITVCPPREIWRTDDAVCIGRPLLTMETALRPLDEARDGDWLSRQHEISEGELVCRGPKLMTGYYKQAEQTAERIHNGWLFTGDVCRRDEDGYLYLSAREDDLIVTAGEKVYPSEIESLLNETPGVIDSVAMGVHHEVWGNVIAAFVVPVSDETTESALADEINRSWDAAAFKRPRIIKVIESIPRNASGKVLRRKLQGLLSEPSPSLSQK